MRLGNKILKVINSRRKDLIDNVISGSPVNRSDYFYGRPAETRSVTVRGSVLLFLRQQFITDNREYWAAGCVSDSGFVQMNGCEPRMLDYEEFQIALTGLHDGASIHGSSKELGIQTSNLSKCQGRLLSSLSWPELICFEFELEAGYKIEAKHVYRAFVPNTNSSLKRKLRKKGIDCVSYNPKYGIEEVMEH